MNIAVIVPSFRDDRILNAIRSIDALRRRSSNRWIIWIQDGGSSHHLLERILELLRPCDHLSSLTDRGIFDALNNALDFLPEEVDYVGWIGSDDVYDDLCDIRTLDSTLEDGPDILVAGTVYCRFGKVRRRFSYSRFWRLASQHGVQYPHFSTIVKRSFIGDERFDIRYSFSSDVDFFLRLNKKLPQVTVLPFVLTEMTEGGTSSKDLRRIIAANRQVFDIYKKHFGLLGAVLNTSLKATTKGSSRFSALLRTKQRPRILEC